MDEFTKRRIENMAGLYGKFDLTDDPGAVDGLAEVYRTTLEQGGHLMRFYHPGGSRKGIAAIIPVGRCYVVAHAWGVSLDEAAETFQTFLGVDTKKKVTDGRLVGAMVDVEAIPYVQIRDCADDCNDCENWDCKVC